jgi:hypothetical protein
METHERHDGRSSWLPPDPRSQICTKAQEETVSSDQNHDEREIEGRGIPRAAELGILRRSWIGTRSRRKPQETRWERRSGEGFTNGGSVRIYGGAGGGRSSRLSRRGRPGWRGAGGWTDEISRGMGLWFFLVVSPLSFFESVSGPCSVEFGILLGRYGSVRAMARWELTGE